MAPRTQPPGLSENIDAVDEGQGSVKAGGKDGLLHTAFGVAQIGRQKGVRGEVEGVESETAPTARRLVSRSARMPSISRSRCVRVYMSFRRVRA